jgi:peptidoglycan/xylan/chitin deacetylase (PgdA/CDA1 family)
MRAGRVTILPMRWLVSGAAVCSAGGLMAYAVRGRSSPLFGPSVYRGSRTRRSIALTFDDGPSEGTHRLLEILNRFGTRATFFVCGMNVKRLPEVACAVATAGHELGNHTYSHRALYLRSRHFISAELDAAQSVIAETTGITPALFRPPFGVRWFGLGEAQRRLNLLGVMWTVVGLDWKLTADRIARRVLAGAGNGGIICLHDGRGVQANPDVDATLEAVGRLIPALQSRGFAFETVSQILCPTN